MFSSPEPAPPPKVPKVEDKQVQNQRLLAARNQTAAGNSALMYGPLGAGGDTSAATVLRALLGGKG